MKEVPFCCFDVGVVEKSVSVVDSTRGLLDIGRGDTTVRGDGPGGLLDSESLGDRDGDHRSGLAGGQFLENLPAILAGLEGVTSGLYLRSIPFIRGLQLEDEGALCDPGLFQLGGDDRERVASDDLHPGR